jgi:hypothetical protein
MGSKMNQKAVIADEEIVIEDEVVEEIDVVDDLDQPDDEVVVSIGEEAPPTEEEVRAPEWVRELRKTNREKERRIRELEAKLTATTTENKPVVTMGPKPKLEDHDYDADRYEQALDAWHERKRQHDLETEMVKKSELNTHK